MKTRNAKYTSPNANMDAEAGTSANAIQKELKALRKERERGQALAQAGGQVSSEGGDDSSDNDGAEDDSPEEDDDIKSAIKANTRMAREMSNAVKAMTKEGRKRRREAAITAIPLPEPKRSKDKEREKSDGKSGRPSPLAFVVGENPEVARDAEGNKSTRKNKYSIN
jgi:hypothetical protein